MILDRASGKFVTWINGVSWWLHLNQRMHSLAARCRPVRVLLATLASVTRNDVQQLIAGVAYYGIVALIPVSVALLQIVGLALGPEGSRGWFQLWSSRILPVTLDLPAFWTGPDATAVGVTGLFALLGLLWGSYKLFGSVGVVINRMWGIEPAQVGILGKARQYMLMSATALVLLASSVFTYMISQDFLPWALRQLDLTGWADASVSFATRGWWSHFLAGLVLWAAFLVLYRYVPERPVRWRWAILGSFVAGGALQFVNYGVALFIAYVAPSHLVYGPLASVLVALMWLFASSITLASGAAVSAYGQSVYDADGPTPGPGWFLGQPQ